VEILPGRDLVVRAGRHAVIQARDRVEMTSTRDSVVLKAEQNMHLLSGNGGEGATIIENRADAAPWDKVTPRQLNQGQPYGSGIVLKSREGMLGLLAPDLYIGGYNPQKKGDLGTDADCNVVVNGGPRGGITMMAAYSYLLGHEVAAVGNSAQVAGMFVSRDVTYLVNTAQFLVGQQIQVDHMTRVSIPLPKLTANGIERDKTPRSFPSTQLKVFGDLSTKGNHQITGSVRVGGGVAADTGCNPTPLANPPPVRVGNSAEKEIAESMTLMYANPLTMLERVLGYGLGKDFGQAMAGVAFPESKPGYNVDPAAWKLPETRWQYLLGHGAAWEETTVEHDILGPTQPYPGKDAYEAKTFRVVLPSGKIELKKLSEYFVNAGS